MICDWDQDKNEILKKERGLSFERIIIAIEAGYVVDILEHHNRKKYPNQLNILIEIDQYIWVVPAVKNEDTYFLKTAFPSRKFTKIYLPEK